MRIGLFLRNLDEEFQITVFRGSRSRAKARGVDLVCVQGETVNDTETGPGRPFALASAVRFDGALVLSPVIADRNSGFSVTTLKPLLGRMPLVSVGMRVPGVVSLAIQSRRSLTRVLEHLILDHGYRRLLFIGGPPAHRDSLWREQIFRRTLADFLPSCPGLEGRVEYAGFVEDRAMEVFRRHLPGPPFDAVVAANDNMAVGVMKVLRLEADGRWDRCAVTGFDDIPQAALEDPPLTSVHQPLEDLGARSVDTLVDLIEARPVPGYRTIPSRPVIRQSCGCIPLETPDFHGPGPWLDRSSVDRRWGDLRRQALEAERGLRASNYLGRDLAEAASWEGVWDRLDQYLGALGIGDFSLLDSPWGGSSPLAGLRLVYERRRGTRTDLPSGGQPLDLEDLFGSLAGDPGRSWEFTVAHLRSGGAALGLAVYSVDPAVHPRLGAVLPHVANAMKRLGLLADQVDRNRRLEEMVEARTRELVEANDKLRHQRLLLESILQSLPVPLVVFQTSSGLILYANRAFDDRVGGVAVSRSVRVFLDLPAECEGVELTLRSGRAGGRSVPVLVYCAPLDFDGQPATLAGMVDLSRQRALEAEVLQTSEFERRRFGLDLHDDICQRLAGITMYLRGFRTRPPADPASTLAELGDLVDQTLQLTRQYAHASFPIDLERRGLDSVLRTLCETTEVQSGRPCRYTGGLGNLDPALESHEALNLYRIVQEALHNAVRHSGASALEVSAGVEGRTVVLQVFDNGKGLTVAPAGEGGIGLRSMAYRASQLGARFSLEGSPGKGTVVRVEIPRVG